MVLDYPSYIAGLFDGEGSFVVSISLKRRKPRQNGKQSLSIAVYQYVGIAQSKETGKQLLENIRDWLKTQGIHSYVPHNGETTKWNPVYALRITGNDNILKFCQLVNGKLLLKQELMENFELITRIRKGYKRLWKWNDRHYLKYENLQNAYKWYEQIAIIWDWAREEYKAKRMGYIPDLKDKLEVIWKTKFPGNGTEPAFYRSTRMEQ